MTVFDQTNSKENSEELLYQAIKEELKPVLDKWFEKCTLDPTMTNRTMIKETSRVVMQFIWRKLGMKIPDYTRRVLDDDYNLMEMIDKSKTE
jgi:hypothetical protein